MDLISLVNLSSFKKVFPFFFPVIKVFQSFFYTWQIRISAHDNYNRHSSFLEDLLDINYVKTTEGNPVQHHYPQLILVSGFVHHLNQRISGIVTINSYVGAYYAIQPVSCPKNSSYKHDLFMGVGGERGIVNSQDPYFLLNVSEFFEFIFSFWWSSWRIF